MKGRAYLFCAVMLLAFPGILWAGTTGKIAGTVYDAEIGEPIPGVNIIVQDTKLGATSDAEGRYFIINVPVGTYTLKALMIGYKPVEVTNVKITLDLTTDILFNLDPTIVEVGDVITVTAQRELIVRDRTSSLRIADSEEIVNLPTRGYEGVVALQAGVTQFEENEGTRVRGQRPRTNTPMLNIRGGREDEVAYFVDGFLQQDPLTGISTTNINSNAIQQVVMQTGGFNAEYGRVMSGTVNVVTKAGTNEYHGQIGAVTDNLSGDWIDTHAYDYNVYDAALGGPILKGNDDYTFYVSGERRWQGDRRPSGLTRSLYDSIEDWDVPDSVAIGDTVVPALSHAIAQNYEGGALPHNTLDGWTWQAKLDLSLTDALNLKVGTLGSTDNWKDYRRENLFNLNHAPRYEDRNSSYFGKLTHTLSPSTFYTAAGNYYTTSREVGDNMYWNDLMSYARPNGNPRYDKEALFISWDDINGPSEVVYDTTEVWLSKEDPTHEFIFVGDGDEARVFDNYLYRKSSYYGFDFDITSQINPEHQVKAGVDFQRHTLRYYETLIPSLLWRGYDVYKNINWFGYDRNATGQPTEQDSSDLNSAKHPITASLYVQDKVEYEGVVINAGVRYDYLRTGAQWLKDEDYPLGKYVDAAGEEYDDSQLNAEDETDAAGYFHPADLEDADDQHYFSPRVGIGFPITDRTVFHVSYGKFFQQPKLIRLYSGYEYLEYMVQVAPYFDYVGNPNLKAEKTTAYEIGISHQLGMNMSMDATAYYKDIEDLIQVATISSFPNGFSTFRNQDFGTVKGVDLSLKMRRTNHVAANVDYSLSFANGTGSVETTNYKVAWTGREVPKMSAPLAYDQRHKFKANLDLRFGHGEGPVFGDTRPLERVGLNVVFTAGSGMPYTPMEVFNEVSQAAVFPTPIAPINSEYGPWTYRIDMKADKRFSVGGFEFNAYVWVLNLLDRKNIVDVYESSGRPDEANWLVTTDGQKFADTHSEVDDSSGLTGAQKYALAQEHPQNYGAPRMVRFGILTSF